MARCQNGLFYDLYKYKKLGYCQNFIIWITFREINNSFSNFKSWFSFCKTGNYLILTNRSYFNFYLCFVRSFSRNLKLMFQLSCKRNVKNFPCPFYPPLKLHMYILHGFRNVTKNVS